MFDDAFEIVVARLIKSGMTEIQALHLIARFLEEEAADYVAVMESGSSEVPDTMLH